MSNEFSIASACKTSFAGIAADQEGFALSALQQAMVAGELSPDRWQRDVVQIRCDLAESVDVAILRQALKTLVERHESLRATLNWNDEGGWQSVVSDAEITLRVIDVEGLVSREQEARINHHLQAVWTEPFDVVHPPRIRASLIRFAAERYQFIITYQETELDEHAGKLLMQEILELYDHAAGKTQHHPSQPVSFRHYLTWLTHHRDTEACHFWGDLLSSAPSPTAPPLMGNGYVDGNLNHCLGNIIAELTQEATSRLKTWVAAQNATLNTALLAAWSRLLAEHSNQEDVRFSAVFSLRDPAYEHAQSAVAMCFSVLPFITRNTRNCSVDELLLKVREHETASRQHSMFLDGSPATRRQLGHPSTQSLIFFDDYDVNDFIHRAHPEWNQRLFSLFGRNPYAIAMRGFGGDRMRIQAWYNPNSYDHQIVRTLLDQLVKILELLPTRGNDRITSSDFITDQHDKQLRQWERGPVQQYRSTLLQNLIHEQAVQSPEAAAVIGDGKTLSYRTLDEQSNQLAHFLGQHNVKPGQTIAVCMGRTPELIISLLGILKAGGSYVPIDASWPAERISGILQRLGTQIVVTDSVHSPLTLTVTRLAPNVSTVIQWDGNRPQNWSKLTSWYGLHDLNGCATSPFVSKATPEDLAYIIFTSGSTGQPKGVAVNHRAVCNLIDWAVRSYHFDGCDRALWVTSPGFDLSVFDIFGLLASGGSVRIATEQDLASPEKLLRILTTEPITFWNSAPQALDRLARWLEQKPLAADADTSNLRLVFLSGDWIPMRLPDAIRHHFGNARVVSLGGATEATVWSNVYSVDHVEPTWRSIPYGRPIQNARYYILNDQRDRCGVGIPGELFIAGDVLAVGYAADSEQTAERFVPEINNTTSESASKMYRTGDLARWWPDGTMEILGRIDHQVKVRGYRIELGEIEQALRSYPEIKEAVVLTRRNDRGDNQIIANIVGSTASAIKYDSLHLHLRRTLPDYMIPSSFVILDGLPATANGKIDRRQLEQSMACCQPLRQKEYLAPQTQQERTLSRIFQRVLRIDRAGTDDNFIELGGDSLSALEVIFTAEQAGIYFTIDQLREENLKTLAAQCQEKHSEATAIAPTANVPLIPNQLWLFERALGRPASYGFMAWLKCNSRIDDQLLAQAWQQVINHHEALRIRFTFDTVLQQHLAPINTQATITQVDLRRCDAKGIDRQLEQIGLKATQQATLLNSPLPSLTCVHMPKNRDLLFVYIPHLITDEYSARIVIDDLASAYIALQKGKIVRLPQATVPISKWAQELTQIANSIKAQQEYHRLCDLPWNKIKPLADESHSSTNIYAHAKDVRMTFSPSETQHLLESARRNQIPLESLLVAVLGHVLGSWIEAEYIIVDMTGAGRDLIRDDLPLHRSTGYFSTIHPVLVPSSLTQPNIEYIRHVDHVLKTAPGKGVWYGLIRYGSTDANRRQHLAALPQAQIKFNYHGLQPLCSESSLFEQADIALPRALQANDKRQYLLNLEIYVHQGCLSTTWKYASHVHHETTIIALASRYLESLRHYVGDNAITVLKSTNDIAQTTNQHAYATSVTKG